MLHHWQLQPYTHIAGPRECVLAAAAALVLAAAAAAAAAGRSWSARNARIRFRHQLALDDDVSAGRFAAVDDVAETCSAAVGDLSAGSFAGDDDVSERCSSASSDVAE